MELPASVVAEPRFRFEALTRQNLPLLFDWLNRPHVARWWDGAVSMAEVRAPLPCPLSQRPQTKMPPA